MSGGGGGGQQTTTSALPAWAQPYAEQILQRGAALSNQELPQYGGSTVAGLSPMQQQALQQIQQQATQGSPVIGAANQALTGMLQQGGNAAPAVTNPYASASTTAGQNPYIGQNPYLAQQVANAQGQTADAYRTGTASQTMGQFRNAGAFGGSAMQQYQDTQNKALGQSLGQVATNMYGQDYANTQQLQQQYINNQLQANLQDAQRNAQYTQAGNQLGSDNWNAAQNRQILAAGQAPTLAQGNYIDVGQLLNAGNIQQGQAQNEANAAYQQWYNRAMSPYQQLGVLQSALSGAMGAGAQGVTTSSRGSGSPMAGALGGAASGAALGSAIMPGWGTAIGAAGGGLMGLFQ